MADIRRVIAGAENRQRLNPEARTVLFIDEIHRFNRAQQDALLPDVERGTVRLLGATTENPFFAVNGPLVSRSQVFQLEPLRPEHLRRLMDHALADGERGLGKYRVQLDDDAAEHLATISDGDARKCLNALEIGVLTTAPDARRRDPFHPRRWPRRASSARPSCTIPTGDGHYDTISAFIKSMRGSDPDAAVYWLAKMLYAGEDIRFIARRLVICAAEDVGLADPQALVVAVAAQQAAEFVGMPEARIPLAEATVYIATAPKSNRAYMAVRKSGGGGPRGGDAGRCPCHLRGTGYKGAKRLGHGVGLPVQPRPRGRLRAAGVSAGRPALLRAERPGRGKTHRRAAGPLAGVVRGKPGCGELRAHSVGLPPVPVARQSSTEIRLLRHEQARQQEKQHLLHRQPPIRQPRICRGIEEPEPVAHRDRIAGAEEQRRQQRRARTPPAGCAGKSASQSPIAPAISGPAQPTRCRK